MTRTNFFIFLLLSVPLCLKAQPFSERATFFTVTTGSDTIECLKIDADITRSKPTILFCQGSLPLPLVMTQQGEFYIVPVSNFDYKTISKKYNIVFISMPHTPLVTEMSTLNKSYAYVPDISKPNQYDNRYLEANYLGKYVERGNAVLEYLRQQPWVDPSRIILFGHSQGAHVAANLAEQNPDIYALGYSSGNVMGRFAQFILENRSKAKVGLISNEEAQAKLENLYGWWREVCREKKEDPRTEPIHSWMSFSSHDIDRLVALKTPVYITYGTEDVGSQSCELMPIYFELAGKMNYKLRPFVGCGHNFERIMPDGKHDFNEIYWNEAINEFLSWCEGL